MKARNFFYKNHQCVLCSLNINCFHTYTYVIIRMLTLYIDRNVFLVYYASRRERLNIGNIPGK